MRIGHVASSVLVATALSKGVRAGNTNNDPCHGYPVKISGDAEHTGYNSNEDPGPAVMYFSGKNGLQGRIIANLQSSTSSKSNGLEWSAPQLGQNMLCIVSAQCGLTASTTPNNATKRIPGYLESVFFTAVEVNRFNDTQGLDPQVNCIFDLGFKK